MKSATERRKREVKVEEGEEAKLEERRLEDTRTPWEEEKEKIQVNHSGLTWNL